MTTQSLQILQSSLPAVPVAVVLTRKLLLAKMSSTTIPADLPTSEEAELIRRATYVTATLKHIQGYDHYGIND